ncbi:MAG: hypothetical protein JXK05_04005 [Campylobacterales bacterium]|nr:hypothetical protein [Campylobacterales bacterium]
MKHEILALKGRIAELKNRITEKELIISGTIIQIRSHADPYEDDYTMIRSGELRTAAHILDDNVKELKKIRSELERLEADLG